ncbi:MAG: metalloprotease TldD [Gammaproteobacteria bacterium]|nr:metalloprotease TldD [Gammaproteobacteria bacterium]
MKNNDNNLEIVKNTILSPSGLDESTLEKLLKLISGKNIDLADLYFQTTYSEGFSLEDGVVKHSSYSIDKGVGLRAVSGEKTGFAYSDDIEFSSLEQAAAAAKSIAKSSGACSDSGSDNIGLSGIKFTNLKSHNNYNLDPKELLYPAVNPLISISDKDKIKLLEEIDTEARRLDPRIKRVEVSLAGNFEVVLIATDSGLLVPDIRPLVRLNVSVIAESTSNKRRETGSFGGGNRTDYNYFLNNKEYLNYAKKAVDQAVLNLEAVDAPAGPMPVVLGPGWPGVLLHEAIGHGLEGDFNRKGTSAFTGRIGERVASPICTVVDDGTLLNRRGSLNVDDEGTPSQKTVLIENGILKGYMQDRLNAKLMGQKPTGNGRRESYAALPMPRMTNTYMLAGNSDPEEIIQSVKKGLYAVNFRGGQVDITSGQFVFSASEAYLIENGKITRPVKGATLIGNGPEVLTKVSMLGNDLELDAGVGTCGKEGQSVPVGVGQPTVKIDELTVGGTV